MYNSQRNEADEREDCPAQRTRVQLDSGHEDGLGATAQLGVGAAPNEVVDAAALAAASRSDPRRSMVRPYARTRGRTQPEHELVLEALVSTSEQGRTLAETVSAECRMICALCVETHSIAEIAARLALPVAVVKVVVGDMAEDGLVLVHQSGFVFGDRSSREFLQRVLDGLRSL